MTLCQIKQQAWVQCLHIGSVRGQMALKNTFTETLTTHINLHLFNYTLVMLHMHDMSILNSNLDFICIALKQMNLKTLLIW